MIPGCSAAAVRNVFELNSIFNIKKEPFVWVYFTSLILLYINRNRADTNSLLLLSFIQFIIEKLVDLSVTIGNE